MRTMSNVRAEDLLASLVAEWRRACADRGVSESDLDHTTAGFAGLSPAEQIALLQHALLRLSGASF
jgi:hypothetical protein